MPQRPNKTKTFLRFILYNTLPQFLSFRYRVKTKGLDKALNSFDKKNGGILVLSTHPTVMVESIYAMSVFRGKLDLRGIAVDYMYDSPFFGHILKLFDSVPVASSRTSDSETRRKVNQEAVETIAKELKRGESFLIYPSGHIKSSELEIIGHRTGVQRILAQHPECNILLLRFKGLWGSMFSRYRHTGKMNPLRMTFKFFACLFLNLFFFAPKRDVILEFEAAPDDFPRQGTVEEVNRWLENWFNQPDGLTKQEGKYPGDSLILTPRYFWQTAEKSQSHSKE